MNSAIYEGYVRHRRYRPIPHEFSYRLFMMYLDLAELPSLFDRRWLWSARHPALACFKREDHVGPLTFRSTLRCAISSSARRDAGRPGQFGL